MLQIFIMNEAYLVLSWSVYFYFHSLLAANSVKEFISNLFSIKSAHIYRIAYNLIALSGIIFLLWLQYTTPSKILFDPIMLTDCIAFGAMLAGLVIMIASIRNYDWKSFIGITAERINSLVISGMNKYVRHPLYSGTMLFITGFCFWQPYNKNLLLLLLMWIYLAIGIIYEEKKLVKIYGPEYKDYQKKVKKMIPFIW